VAFTHSGDYVAGARQFLLKATQPTIDELSAGYIIDDSIIFIAYNEQMIFRFDPARMELDYFSVTFPEPFSIVNAEVFAGDDKQAYAIFDNRVHLSYDPNRPAFELATFEPNSIGQTIVSDTTKAGLLEISDFL
jgi:hypothetical protein